MKRWFIRLPIHQKLVVMALLVTTIALLIATAGVMIIDAWRFRTAAFDEAVSTAGVIAENTAAAVTFKDQDVARSSLASVRVRPTIRKACLYLTDGSLFAAFERSAEFSCPTTQPAADSRVSAVTGTATVSSNERVIATVFVERDLADLWTRIAVASLTGLGMLVLAGTAALLLANRLNRMVSEPIAQLAVAARAIRPDDDRLDAPTVVAGEDEVGDLVRAFSEMLRRLQSANVDRRESERRFRTLADGSPVLLWVNGPDGCEFVNRAYLEFVGLESDMEVRGFDWTRFVHPDDRQAYLDHYRRCYHSRVPFSAEFRFLRSDREWRWMRSEATPRVGEATVSGFVGATVDITERRRAEEALREADRRKDAFLAILAHELRNPLAPIRTGIELLRLGGGKPGVLERVRPMLERQVAHMVRLIDDLLDVSRITSGKIQLQRQPSALRDLVQSSVDANRGSIDAAGLTLSVNLPETPCMLDVDPTRFVQVLSNLLHNATKFTDRGGQVRIDANLDGNVSSPTLSLSVSDTGEGIPARLLPHVFDFFVQGDANRRPKSGLGIGLGLAKQLIEMQGGSIEAQSAGPGSGSSFTITLPVLTWHSIPTHEELVEAEVPRLLDRRVLVIDDNIDAADTLSGLVTALGGEAHTAYDARTGLQCASQLRPDVVLLDIGMPEMDGYETCRRLRAESYGRDAYIVAVTGWGQLHDRERALADGFDAYLTKPADPRVLGELLANAPKRKGRSAPRQDAT
jgi:PAS domain S-box-containing protein